MSNGKYSHNIYPTERIIILSFRSKYLSNNVTPAQDATVGRRDQTRGVPYE